MNCKSVIYSFGIGENLGFEKKMANLYNLKVYCFDPTSLATKFISNEIYDKNKFFFKPFGIWNIDGKVNFLFKMSRMPAIQEALLLTYSRTLNTICSIVINYQR